jgi:anti-sigma factor ChrR (cupin superfamily)
VAGLVIDTPTDAGWRPSTVLAVHVSVSRQYVRSVHEELVARGLDALLRQREPSDEEATELDTLLASFDDPERAVTIALIRAALGSRPIEWDEIPAHVDEWVSWFWTSQERLDNEREFQAVMDEFGTDDLEPR